MIFFSFTRIVARISFIPIIVVAVIGYIIAKNSSVIAEGLMNALIALAIWFGATFGLAGGIITAIMVMRRRIRYRSPALGHHQIHNPARGKQDAVIDWTLKPAAIEAVKGVTINGLPIEEWQKQHP